MHNNELKNELGKNFIEYAVAVNTDRAIPDAKSGLKPVAKRILWSAFEEGRLFNKPHVKSARIVGDVMGKYHPHGDSSIYGAMVRLSQNWVLRYPLIDWHGSNGNIAGDGPAAARYTEARLSKIAEYGMLQGIRKNNVEFIDNYDETLKEPITLPTIFPNLLCNPNTGIGVAMACNWLPHNLKEVAQAVYDYIEGKEPMLIGPDFPTGGQIINKNDIPNIMKTGKGSVKVRGKYKIEKNTLIFYEIPYGVSTENLLKQIGELCDKKEIEGIEDIRDESNKKGLRIAIECEKGVNPDSIAQKLFIKSSLQSSISYNQVALVDKVPTELNLKKCIKIYIEHNIECIEKEAQFDLDKALNRIEIVNGLLKALEDIDNIIKLIKASQSAVEANKSLIEKYNFSERQAKAILDMKLAKLANLEKIELQNEKTELNKTIEELNALLSSKDLQINKVKTNLQDIVNKFGDERKTEIIQIDTKEKELVEVIPEDVVVVLTKNGLIKKVPKKSYKIQNRGGKGFKTDDIIIYSVETNTVDKILLFSNSGKMYQILVDLIPTTTNSGKGTPVNSLIKVDANDNIIAATSLQNDNKYNYIAFFTKMGLMKKTKISEYNTAKKSGIQAIKLKENDSIANIIFLNDKEEVLVVTKKGISIHFGTADIAPIGRVTSGVKVIKLMEDDELLKGFVLTDLTAIVTKDGFGKIVEKSEFTLQSKYGKGIKCTNGEEVADAISVDKNSSLLVCGKPNSIVINIKDLTVSSRTATGRKIINGSEVSGLVKLNN